MPKVNGLTDKQRRFVQEYLIDLNATQAAIRAGYSAKTAQEQSSRLLSNVMVQGAVEALQAQQAEDLGYTRERIARMLEEDRGLARKNNHTSAAVSASMGLAKLHGLITDKVEHRAAPSEMTDAELERIARDASRGGNGAARPTNGKAQSDSVH